MVGPLSFCEVLEGSDVVEVEVVGGGGLGVFVGFSSVVDSEVDVVNVGGAFSVVEVSGSEVTVGVSSFEVTVGSSAEDVEESSGTGRMLSPLFPTSVVVSSFWAFPKPTPNTATSRVTERRKRESVEKRCILDQLVPDVLLCCVL